MSLESISKLQEQLQNILGENYSRYLENMKDWFGQRVTKDFYDEQMSRLLQDGSLKVHNELMKQIIFLFHNPQNQNSSAGTSAAAGTVNNNSGRSRSRTVLSSSSRDQLQNGQSQHQNGSERMVIYQSSESGGQHDAEYVTINYVNDPTTRSGAVLEKSPVEQPANWLYQVEVNKPTESDIQKIPYCSQKKKFPPPFALQSQPLKCSLGGKQTTEIQHNVTHVYDIADRLNKNPQLKPHFKKPIHENQPHLSVGASLHGRFLLKAWESGLESVDQHSTTLVADSVKEHVRRLLTEVVKQRKAFRMRNDRVCHSLGSPYPNPYLRQGQQLFDNPYCSDSTKMADVMQIPTLLPTADEQERIACLQISSAAPPKNCRFPSNKATLADLRCVLQAEPGIIPYANLRLKLMTKIEQKYKGWGGAVSDEEEEGELLPMCSY